MRIEFKLGDFSDIIDDHYDVLEEYEPAWIQLQDDEGWGLRIDGYRVVIPEIHISFRMGELFAVPDDPDEEWDFVHSVTVYYEENEEDIEKVLAYSYGATDSTVIEACKKYNYPVESLDDIGCYMDVE